jgi:hypothetical protein
LNLFNIQGEYTDFKTIHLWFSAKLANIVNRTVKYETVGLEYDVQHQATRSSEKDLEAYTDYIVSTSFESSNNDEVL